MKKEIFNVELDRIKDQDVRLSTETLLEMLPDYFFKVPASSSGKYHPQYALGEGGLVRHVKVAMRNLEKFFTNEVFGVFDDYEKDLMRMALLLHDGLKSGMPQRDHTVNEHPVLMHDFILEHKDELLIPEEDARFVASLILTHMGPWNKDRAGNVIMPVPKTDAEKVVHLCDFIASFNYLDAHFEDNELVDSVDRAKVLKK